MKYLVNFATGPEAEINGAWMEVTAESHQGAAIEALRPCINFYAPFGLVHARVHAENDPKHDNGKPALIHNFALKLDPQRKEA